MNLFLDLPYGNKEENYLNMVVDIPRGSSNKYEFDEKGGYFKLDRTLYHSMFYPFEYGFCPQTIAPDGDPLDMVLLTTYPTFTGCVVKVRPIGMIDVADEAGEDAKIICVPVTKIDPRWEEVKTIEDLSSHEQKELLLFFKEYKKLEETKYHKVEVRGFKNVEETWKHINLAREVFTKEHSH